MLLLGLRFQTLLASLDHRPQMAVAFLLFFCRFALVFTAFCLFLAVPMVHFSTLFSPFWCFFKIVGVGFSGGWGGFGGA